MTDPAAAATTVVLLAPNAEDKAWADKTMKTARGTFRETTVNAYLANELATAIDDKKFWRVNHLLTTGYRFGLWGKQAAVQDVTNFAKTAERAAYAVEAYSYGRIAEVVAAKYPALAKYARSTASGVILEQGAPEGVQLLVGSGVTSVSQLAREAVQSNNAAALDLLERQEPGIAKRSIPAHYDYRDQTVPLITWAAMRPQAQDAFDWVLARNPEGATLGLLQTAIRYRNEEAALKILAVGVSPADVNAWSPLDYAVQAGLPKLVAAILDKNTDPAFRDTAGGTLLIHAVSSRWDTGWEARTAVVDAILAKLPVGAEDLSKAIGFVPTDSVAYKHIRAALVSQEGGPAIAWRLMGPQQVGTVSFDRENGLQLSEVFNFATAQRLVLSRNLKTGADALLQSEGFAELKDKKGLEGAQAFYEQRMKKTAAPKAG